MGITIADNLVQLKIQAEKVKIATLQLEDFNLPKLLIADFLADSNGYISLKSFCSQWVYVLPSMKKGRVLSISKQLPPQSIFADYTQLRRHWKNMYGYRLPTTADNILFYEIQFPVPNPYSFIYPHICLAFKPLKSFKCPDLRSTAFKFIQDMVSTLSKICGKLIVINQIEEKCNLRQSIIKGNAVEKSLFTPKRLSLPRFSEIICQEGRSQINEIFTPGLEFSAKYKNPLLPLTHQKIKTAEKSTSESSQLSVGKESTEGQASFSNSKSTDSSTLQKYKADDKVKGRTIVIPKERDISRYFKQQKASSSIDNNTQTTKYKKYKKESGLNLSSLSNNILKTRDNYIKIMTDLNKLNEVTISTLKLWLNDHSIPYKSKDSKAILINNILSHIKTSKPSL
ncbi:uncharacterized protein [Prorops nasuta]|uniref:uncharacterized protein isoform X2 n=1 Tax=Prorops nasuta TaxID=863751 RepID=UPI0034CD3F8C